MCKRISKTRPTDERAIREVMRWDVTHAVHKSFFASGSANEAQKLSWLCCALAEAAVVLTRKSRRVPVRLSLRQWPHPEMELHTRSGGFGAACCFPLLSPPRLGDAEWSPA